MMTLFMILLSTIILLVTRVSPSTASNNDKWNIPHNHELAFTHHNNCHRLGMVLRPPRCYPNCLTPSRLEPQPNYFELLQMRYSRFYTPVDDRHRFTERQFDGPKTTTTTELSMTWTQCKMFHGNLIYSGTNLLRIFENESIHKRRMLSIRQVSPLLPDKNDDDDDENDVFPNDYDNDDENVKREVTFLRSELQRLEQLEKILAELDEFASPDEAYYPDNEIGNIDEYYDDQYDSMLHDDDNMVEDDNEDFVSLDQDVLLQELLESFPDDISDEDEEEEEGQYENNTNVISHTLSSTVTASASPLEVALLQGVVPADAGVGSGQLPGDFGFDPLQLSTRDYILTGQQWISNLLLLPFPPSSTTSSSNRSTSYSSRQQPQQRPRALILRDYREAEIRHGRLAMLAAMIWPLQEMLDQFVLGPMDKFGSLLFGHITLPYFPLFMTAVMLLLGYLDIYSAAIKDMDQIGEAFLPGDCFWDPLHVLEGTPAQMKRNMQERELFNGRMAMLAFAVFVWEESTTHKPLISIAANELLFKPLYQVSFIQEFLDTQ